jgi:hypothetical protein
MSSSLIPDIGERRAAQRTGRSISSVVWAVVSFYVAAALLNGRFLHEDAKEREYGKVRDVWVSATRPLYELSTLLQLDSLRGNVETLRKE